MEVKKGRKKKPLDADTHPNHLPPLSNNVAHVCILHNQAERKKPSKLEG